MSILAINSGSQTLKYKLYQAESFKLIKEGKIENIGFGKIKNHFEAINQVREEIQEYESELKIIGHRYVNGGLEFIDPQVIDQAKAKTLEQYNSLAPLHNPANLAGIRATLKMIPQATNVAVFDTHFYKDLPEVAWRYALNKKIADENNYRRLGFHGISHAYAVSQVATVLKKKVNEMKIISLHLGGGASITATNNGKVVDTSMGFTPAEGLMMMTRSGDIDPGILIDLVRKGMGGDELDELLNYQSGIYGICNKQSMLAVLEDLKEKKTKDVQLAFEMYVYRIKKYIGAYYAILGGCDALVFTGTIGAGNPETREAVMEGLDFVAEVPVLVIPTDEEIMIAKEAYDVVKSS
ncbi:MAG: acetate/propionate family kinase [Patescibacteria group bacterium]|nr:acetate/propionate family kinase [Patescibacteria group bacterium]